MGYCLYLSFIQQQRRLNERLSISGRTGVYDFHILRQFAVDVFDRMDRSSKRIAIIIVIKRIEKGTVFSYESGFVVVDPASIPRKAFPL